MTREEAIRHIRDVIAENNSIKPNIVTFEQEKEALYMAIEALSAEEAVWNEYEAEFTDLPDIPRYYYEKVVGKMAHEINMLKEQLESADAESDDLIIKGAKGIQDGLYNIKDGKLFKYKAKGGTVRTYPIVPSADAEGDLISREETIFIVLACSRIGNLTDEEKWDKCANLINKLPSEDAVSREEYDFKKNLERINDGILSASKKLEDKGLFKRVDFVEVVRCKDCRHWLQHEQFGFDEDNGEYHDYCALLVPDDDYYAYTRKADDFCSYGERKEE